MQTTYLILHGWNGSGPDHWQSWLASRLRAQGWPVVFPTLPQAQSPRLSEWKDALAAQLRALAIDWQASRSGDPLEPGAVPPIVVVCHSLACLLWLHHAEAGSSVAVERVVLVAPPGPEGLRPATANFAPVPLNPLSLRRAALRTHLVCTDADPACPERASEYYGRRLNLPTTVLPPSAAHINVASGFGPWPWIEDVCLGRALAPLSPHSHPNPNPRTSGLP